MRRLMRLTALAVLAASGMGNAETYWVEYNAASGIFPEDDGWTRYTAYGGAQRWFEDGAMALDTRAYAGILDYVVMYPSGPLDPGPGETFVMQWRLKIQEINPRYAYDVTVGIISDDWWGVGFHLGLDFVDSAYENQTVATFVPYVYHDFCLTSASMRDYVLWIDGQEAGSGVFIHVAGPPRVGWGDSIMGATSLSRWSRFGFGAVPSPRAGDLNCDGAVDFADINPFVLALIDPDAYEQAYPGCWPENGDVNGDGGVGFDDINPFVALLMS